jgi:HSP20 family protein
MTLSRRPSPFGELLSLRQAMDRLLEDSFVRPRGWGSTLLEGGAAPLDVTMTADELVVEAALPGVDPEAVDITVADGTLTIRGEVRSERNEGEGDHLVQEIRRGEFSRSIGLPNGLEPDKANASFRNGILTLRIPKAEQVRPRQIRITTNGNQQTGTTTGGNATTGTNATAGTSVGAGDEG